MWRLYHGLGGSDDPNDQTLRATALLAIGAVGGKMADQNLDYGRQVGEQLAGALTSSSDDNEKVGVLNAISNYGGTELIPYIEPQFRSENEEVRSRAYFALRRMDEPEAARLLMDHYETESSAKVKQAALKTLAAMPARPDNVNWGRNELSQTVDDDSRILLTSYLGQTMKDFPENEKSLRALLETNPPFAVKRQIYRYIAPQ